MKVKELLNNIEGVFVPPVKRYYLGKLVYGTPYFWPMNFNPNIITVRKLIKTSKEELDKLPDNKWVREAKEFKNKPMVRRSRDWVISLFGNHYFIEVGWPFMVHRNELGWKDKFNSPRFEWPPAFYIFFFHWQFVIHWNAPDGNNDRYYEMILQYLFYQDRDIDKTKKNWGWVDSTTKKSTWNKDYLL